MPDNTNTPVGVSTEEETSHRVEKRIKRQEDVLWFKVLDRFGLPTLFALILLIGILNIGNKLVTQMATERKDYHEVLTGFIAALGETTQTLKDVQKTLAIQGKVINNISDRQNAIEHKLGISRPAYDKPRENEDESRSR